MDLEVSTKMVFQKWALEIFKIQYIHFLGLNQNSGHLNVLF